MGLVLPGDFNDEMEEKLMKNMDYRTIVPKSKDNDHIPVNTNSDFLGRFIAKRSIYKKEENVYCHPIPVGRKQPQNVLAWCSFGPKEIGAFDFEIPLSSKGSIPVLDSESKATIAFWPLGMFCSKKEAWDWVNNELKIKNPNALFWNIRVDIINGPRNIIPNDNSYSEVEWNEEYHKIMANTNHKVNKASNSLLLKKAIIQESLRKKQSVSEELLAKYRQFSNLPEEERTQHESDSLKKLLSQNIGFDVISDKSLQPKGDIRSLPASCVDLYCQMERFNADPMDPFKWVLLKNENDSTVYLAKQYL